jgi:hypothetical protein
VKILKWFAARLKDLLYDPSNEHLDNGRCIAALSLLSLVGAAGWNMHLHKEIDLSAFGTGMSLVLGALVAYLYHDRKQSGT